MNLKICIKCNIEKSVENFAIECNKNTGNFYTRNKCKECRIEELKIRINSDPQKYFKKMKSHLKSKYNISEIDKENLIILQNNKCVICSKIFVSKKSTHIDHCHFTNKVRGILCQNCNNGLGQFKDNKNFLNAADKYLSNHEDFDWMIFA